MAKVNSLQDREHLPGPLPRRARPACSVMLNVRGICCLRPGVKGVSENIEVRSHRRPLPGARPHLLLPQRRPRGGLPLQRRLDARNLDRRLEILFPVLEPRLRQRMAGWLDVWSRDNVKAYRLRPDGTYERVSRRPPAAARPGGALPPGRRGRPEPRRHRRPLPTDHQPRRRLTTEVASMELYIVRHGPAEAARRGPRRRARPHAEGRRPHGTHRPRAARAEMPPGQRPDQPAAPRRADRPHPGRGALPGRAARHVRAPRARRLGAEARRGAGRSGRAGRPWSSATTPTCRC